MSSFEWMELESLSLEISNAEVRLAEAQSGDLVHLAKDIETQIANAKARRDRLVDAISERTASIAVADDEEPTAAAKQELELRLDSLEEDPDVAPYPAEQNLEPTSAGSSCGEFGDEGCDRVDCGAEDAIASLDEAEAVAAFIASADEPAAEYEAGFDPVDADGSDAVETEADAARSVVPGPFYAPISDFPEPTDGPRSLSAVDATEGATPMWEQFSPADIVRAKQELEERRTEMLARHAEELKALDAEYIEIATLERALEAFARKFSKQPEGGEVVRLDEERDLRMNGTA